MTPAVGFGAALAVATLLSWGFAWRGIPLRENYRGRDLFVALGAALVGGWAAGEIVARVVGTVGMGSELVWGTALVFVAGLVDDLLGGGEARGVRGHLESLVRGRLTTGILKILAGFAGGAIVVSAGPAAWPVRLTGLVLIAACTNLWNVLDVRPARALKAFLPLQVVLALSAAGSLLEVRQGALLGAALGVLPWDLRERAMLGDAGSNVLGFAVGVGLYSALPLGGLLLALGAVLVLQVAAETVTISRLIDAVPPLRWYDRFGRIPE